MLTAVAAMLALAGCSSSDEAKKTEPKKEAVAPKKDQAPDNFKVHLDTSKGQVILEIHRDWAPIGADHLYQLVKEGFYDDNYFFRYVRGFIVQFGINGDSKTNSRWNVINLLDDPVKHHNTKGTLTYATAGPRTRSTQLFINLKDNTADLDQQGFSPLGEVVEGMNVVTSLYSGYGDMPQQGGAGPDSEKIETQGNQYLKEHFPRLDYIKKATIE
jgi:peptidyl-prolyl cis-trans isomerase A (cyclophilin A)